MKCDMPDCCNDFVKTYKLHGIYAGVAQKVEVYFCNNHKINEINKRIDEICDNKICTLQNVNPFKDVKMHINS